MFILIASAGIPGSCFSLQGRQKSDFRAGREARKGLGDALLIGLWNVEALGQLPTGSSQHTSGGGRATSP